MKNQAFKNFILLFLAFFVMASAVSTSASISLSTPEQVIQGAIETAQKNNNYSSVPLSLHSKKYTMFQHFNLVANTLSYSYDPWGQTSIFYKYSTSPSFLGDPEELSDKVPATMSGSERKVFLLGLQGDRSLKTDADPQISILWFDYLASSIKSKHLENNEVILSKKVANYFLTAEKPNYSSLLGSNINILDKAYSVAAVATDTNGDISAVFDDFVFISSKGMEEHKQNTDIISILGNHPVTNMTFLLGIRKITEMSKDDISTTIFDFHNGTYTKGFINDVSEHYGNYKNASPLVFASSFCLAVFFLGCIMFFWLLSKKEGAQWYPAAICLSFIFSYIFQILLRRTTPLFFEGSPIGILSGFALSIFGFILATLIRQDKESTLNGGVNRQKGINLIIEESKAAFCIGSSSFFAFFGAKVIFVTRLLYAGWYFLALCVVLFVLFVFFSGQIASVAPKIKSSSSIPLRLKDGLLFGLAYLTGIIVGYFCIPCFSDANLPSKISGLSLALLSFGAFFTIYISLLNFKRGSGLCRIKKKEECL